MMTNSEPTRGSGFQEPSVRASDFLKKVLDNDASKVDVRLEEFLDLSPMEQAAVYQGMMRHYFSGMEYKTRAKLLSAAHGMDDEFQQFFDLQEFDNQVVTHPNFLDRIGSLFDRGSKSLGNDINNDQILSKSLTILYQEIYNTKELPSEDWLAEQAMRTRASFISESKEWYIGFPGEVVQEAIERRKPGSRREFKIHLNPTAEALPKTAERFMRLLHDDPYVHDHLVTFKINCQDNREPITSAPRFVIYPVAGKTPEESMEIACELIKRLSKAFEQLESEALPVEKLPRYNFPISRMIHVSQCSGDLKNRLWRYSVNVPDPASKYPSTIGLLDKFFDATSNHAFFSEDAKNMRRLLESLQTKDAKGFVEKLRR